MESAENDRAVEPNNLAGTGGSDRRITQELPIQTSLAKKIASAKNSDHGFLAIFGKYGDFDRPADDVEKRVGGVALRVDSMFVGEFRYDPTAVLSDEGPVVKVFFLIFCHDTKSPLPTS